MTEILFNIYWTVVIMNYHWSHIFSNIFYEHRVKQRWSRSETLDLERHKITYISQCSCLLHGYVIGHFKFGTLIFENKDNFEKQYWKGHRLDLGNLKFSF